MDYEKLRRKKEAEAQARLDVERQERRVKEEKERQRLRKEFEKRKWDEMGMAKQRERHDQDITDATNRTQNLVKKLEEKKQQGK